MRLRSSTAAALALLGGPLFAMTFPAAASSSAAAVAKAPAGRSTIVETETSFANGDVRLAGVVLSAPGGGAPRPGAVIVHGSGTSGRTQAWAADFARGLAERGFAVLLPDKRGSGESGGDWRTASFADLADDATVGPYDPLPHWRELAEPAVIAYGAQDTQIHVAESVALLLGLPQEPAAPRTVLVFGDSGHDLRQPSGDGIRPDLLDFLASWAAGLPAATGKPAPR